MPQHYLYETAITIDHETGEMLVDTTREGVASQLRRCKFLEITREDSRPYRRFKGQSDQFKFRRTKADRPVRALTGFARKKQPANADGTHTPEKL